MREMTRYGRFIANDRTHFSITGTLRLTENRLYHYLNVTVRKKKIISADWLGGHCALHQVADLQLFGFLAPIRFIQYTKKQYN